MEDIEKGVHNSPQNSQKNSCKRAQVKFRRRFSVDNFLKTSSFWKTFWRLPLKIILINTIIKDKKRIFESWISWTRSLRKQRVTAS